MATGKEATATTSSLILEGVGGASNVARLTHCATRLRFELVDPGQANLPSLNALPEVMRALQSGGQTQVIVGGAVERLYKEVNRDLSGAAPAPTTAAGAPAPKRENIIFRFIALIASVFTPILPALIGAGMIKALATILQSTGVIAPDSTLFTVTSIVGDSVFYFLPFLLASSAAKKFDTNPYLAMLLAAVLLHPTWVALVASTKQAGEQTVSLLGAPVLTVTYSSTVIPIILGTWLLKHVVNAVTKILPEAIRVVFVPMLSMIVMVPVMLIVVGPAGHYVGQLIGQGVVWLFASAGWFAQAVLGGTRPILTMFGLHYSFLPIQVQEVAATGATALLVGAFAANLAQAGAALALSVLTRGNERSGAAATGVTAFFGITEPAIYGYNLRYRFPFFISCGAAAISAGILGALNVSATAVTLPNILAIGILQGDAPLWVFAAILIGGAVIAFVATLLYGRTFGRQLLARVLAEAEQAGTGFEDPAAAATGTTPASGPTPAAAAAATGAQATSVAPESTFVSPMTGDAVALTEVDDAMFSGEVMGPGVAIRPTEGLVVSPVDAEVVSIASSKHAVGLRARNGVELLIHVGIDTVRLGGEPFTVLVQPGDTVTAGQPLLRADLDAIRSAGMDTTTPVVVLDPSSAVSLGGKAVGPVTRGDRLFDIEGSAR